MSGSLNVPAKIKFFGWRVLHGLISCPGVLAIDILVWTNLGLWSTIEMATISDHSCSSCLVQMILNWGACVKMGNIGIAEITLTGAWYIWWERRQSTHGENIQNPTWSAMSIGVLATNYWHARKKPIKKKKQSWSCPPEGYIKINVDASFDLDQGKGSMGAIARDFTGKFVVASCKEIHFITDPIMAEAYALRDGLSLAQHLRCRFCFIQSGNVQAIEIMKSGGLSSTSSVDTFDDCRILSSGCGKIKLEHCQREANEVADELARVLLTI